jgi:hypothetical protein
MSDFGYRVFESTDESTYPTELVWEAIQLGVGVTGGRIIDGDLDGKREITARVGLEVLTYENLGDNAYAATLVGGIPPDTFQSFEVLDDIDDDGRPEILQGSLGNIFAFESIGDDAYEPIWTWEDISNVSFMVNAGDLDGDGRKEFLAGGWDGSVGASVLYIFESVGNNQVDVVATLLQNNGAEAYTSAEVADVDGDGRFEIVFATTWVVSIHENVGNDSWEQIWSANWGADAAGPMQYVAAGDHDGDGKAEIIFNQGGYTESFTGVWEIDPAYAADPDHDGRVTVIDNCPSQYNPDQADADGDAVGDVCDNCVHGPNPAQGFAPLGQAIVATDTDTFSWVLAADVVYVRGDLAAVASYGVDTMQTLPLATSLTDASIPGSGSGFYYLLRPDCSVGSWQTEIGAEPGRDVTLP